MRIASVNTHDCAGGAARVAMDLHREYIRRGHEAVFLTGMKVTREPAVYHWNSCFVSLARRVTGRVERATGLQYVLEPSVVLGGRRWFDQASVVHLHNIHGGYFNIGLLPYLARRHSVVWTLHDMWALTGHCAHAFDCDEWLNGCETCAWPSTEIPIARQSTHLNVLVKRLLYAASDPLTVVTPSEWLAAKVRHSILAGARLEVIPNAVDTRIFRPADRWQARRALGLCSSEPMVLAAGAGVIANTFKGFAVLAEALLDPDLPRLHVVIAGGGGAVPKAVARRHRITDLGPITDQHVMAAVYSACDVFALPSLAENCPLAVLEAMASSRPVVASSVGGVPELVAHLRTGYLARVADADDFARGLLECLADGDRAAAWGAAGRERVVERHTLVRQSSDYCDLFGRRARDARSARH